MRNTFDFGADAPGPAAPERARVGPADLPPLGATKGVGSGDTLFVVIQPGHRVAVVGAAAAGLSPPQVGAPLPIGVGERRGMEQGKGSSVDCADHAVAGQPPDDDKRFATLRVRLALAGWALSRNAAGDRSVTYSASRWNMARELVSLDAVAEFADRVGAPR